MTRIPYVSSSELCRRQAAAKLGAPRPALAAKLDAARKLGRSSQRVISERVRLLVVS